MLPPAELATFTLRFDHHDIVLIITSHFLPHRSCWLDLSATGCGSGRLATLSLQRKTWRYAFENPKPVFRSLIMPRYVIERDLPGAGKLTAPELQAISQKSCSV